MHLHPLDHYRVSFRRSHDATIISAAPPAPMSNNVAELPLVLFALIGTVRPMPYYTNTRANRRMRLAKQGLRQTCSDRDRYRSTRS